MSNSEYNAKYPSNVRVIEKAIHLKWSQSSFLEQYDGNIADQYANSNVVSVFPEPPLNDGTNACAFLCVKIADEIITASNISNWNDIAQIAETVITTIPEVINKVRDRALRYDVMEAYSIMKDNDCLRVMYEFSEELPYSNSAFSQEGKTQLMATLESMKESNERVSIYTCEPYTFVIGSKMDSLFILDTHPVPLEAGGQNLGILKTFSGPSSAEKIAKAACLWLWQRLSSAGVQQHQPQSLSIMQKDVRSSDKTENEVKLLEYCQEKLCNQDVAELATTSKIEQQGQTAGGKDHGDAAWDLIVLSSDDETDQIDRNTTAEKEKKSPNILVDLTTCTSSDSDDCSGNTGSDRIDQPIQIVKPTRKRNFGELYNGKEMLPVYDWSSKNKTPAEICKILKPSEDKLTCRAVPSNVSHNVCFLLDTSCLESQNDWKCDDMGSWKNNGVQRIQMSLDLEEDPGAIQTNYKLKRIYYKNNSSPDVKKVASFLEDHPNLIFIQYIFDHIEHQVHPNVHGNSKKRHSSPYIRIKDSTVQELKREASVETPKVAYHNVHRGKGGVLKASSISDLPRNRAQAKYARRGHTNSTNLENADSLVILLEQCKRQQINRYEVPFIREVTGAPELRCILGFDWQLRDLATFCTDPQEFSVFGADPTFNLGKFNVTVTSYQNLKVIDRASGKHPMMIGPLLISQTKCFDAYNHFFSKMLSLDKETRGILAYGTDGEEELYRAMKLSFPHAVHLRFFAHFRDNCKDQLKHSNVPEEAQNEFLFDLFGCRVGDTLEKGLLDADGPDDFRNRLASVKDVWDLREKHYLASDQHPKFYRYILGKEEMIVQCMLTDARRHAGLGDPPAPYYNNIPESANALIKRGVGFKESEMSKFCEEMSILLQRQKEDVESAIINHGPYYLAPKFAHLELSQEDWFKKSGNQKESCIKTFHNAKMSTTNYSLTDQQNVSPPSHQRAIKISVDVCNAGLKSACSTTLQHISAKAEDLLNRNRAIIQAPTSDESVAYMVESETMVRPHYVTVAKNGKITCADCPGWNAYKICAHSLAVAEKSGCTSDYLRWLTIKGPQVMNLTSLVTCDSGKGVGRKGGKSSTARRKGGRNSKNTPPTTVVDRVAVTAVVSAPTSREPPSYSQSTLVNPPLLASQPIQMATNPVLRQVPYSNPFSTRTVSMNNQPSNTTRPSIVSPFTSVIASPNTPPSCQFRVTLLQLCHPLVRQCYGCSQVLKPGGTIASPPYDMVVMAEMNREYRHRNTGEVKHKEGNTYFHVKICCIGRRQPYFCPQMVFVSEEAMRHLMPVHFHYLREFGVILH